MTNAANDNTPTYTPTYTPLDEQLAELLIAMANYHETSKNLLRLVGGEDE